jgi:hypothetical protein
MIRIAISRAVFDAIAATLALGSVSLGLPLAGRQRHKERPATPHSAWWPLIEQAAFGLARAVRAAPKSRALLCRSPED